MEAGFEIPDEGIRSFEIEFVRGGIAPDHLFTREEIEREDIAR